MPIFQICATLITVIIIPFITNAIKTKAMSGNVARWVALVVSVLGGAVVGFVTGIPNTPEAWLTTIFACIGGIQVAYSTFKTVGVTSKWLDALLEVQTR